MYKGKNKIKASILSLALGLGGYQAGSHKEVLMDTLGDQAEYVVMNEIGIAQFSALSIPVVRELEHIDGRLVKLNRGLVAQLRGSGARVFKNRKNYHISMGDNYKRPPKECLPCEGDGSPIVDPVIPDGSASPVPPSVDNVPWGTLAINAPQANKVTGAQNITVCILDTGLDSDHPEFRNMTIQGKSFIKNNGSWEDNQGHGTHVASTIGAAANNDGMIGVSQARIAVGKVLDKNGSGTSVAISEGIIWCTDVVGAQIISMSLGSSRAGGSDPLIRIATDHAIGKGVIVIAAAGNDGRSTGCGFPAANPGVYCVSASTEQGKMASFSTHGKDVDFIAPGTRVLGAQMGGGYVQWDGTSMATPHVAAVWALALSMGHRDIDVRSLGLPREQQGRGQVDAIMSIK